MIVCDCYCQAIYYYLTEVEIEWNLFLSADYQVWENYWPILLCLLRTKFEIKFECDMISSSDWAKADGSDRKMGGGTWTEVPNQWLSLHEHY